jgi:hypothetical protein
MKRIFLVSLITVISCYTLSASTNTITTSGGGFLGYQQSKLKVDIEGNVTISATGSGLEQCDKSSPSNVKAFISTSQQERLCNLALTEIARNKLSGNYTKDGITVTWTSENIFGTDCTITITDNKNKCNRL